MIWTLYRLELFKMVKRLATWVTLISFGVLTAFTYGGLYYNSINHEGMYFGLPEAWPLVLSNSATVVAIFAGALQILLVANEFDWRTSRQNIIDGLSRNQWFTAKILLLPTLFVMFYMLHISIAGTLVWLGTDQARENAMEISNTQLLAVCGAAIGGICFMSIACFVSFITRSTGPALGITFIYMFIEALVTRTLRGLDLDRLADFSPMQVHAALLNFNQYYQEGTRQRGWTTIDWDTPNLFATGIAWIIIFLTAAWLVYRKRDL